MERFYTAKDICSNLGVTGSGLNNMLRLGSFPAPDLGGKGAIRRWKESTIKKWEGSLEKKESDK